jgi:glycerophosphoryl diester phosphodiesterase
MAAFACAQRMGLSDVELDVRLSRDGVLVLFNGASLEEKTPLVGRVEDYEVAELVQADVGRWFDAVRGDGSETHAGERLTTLVDVVARFGASLRYHVELKGAQLELPARTLEVCRAYPAVAFVVTSFRFDHLVRARELDRDISLCWLLGDDPRDPGAGSQREFTRQLDLQCERIERAARAGFTAVGVRAAACSREVVACAREYALAVRAWGVHTQADLEHALASGIGGLTVDWPLEALRRLPAQQVSRGVALESDC